MTYQSVVLLISGILNLMMSFFILSKGTKNKVNLYFSLLTFSTFLWSLLLFTSLNVLNDSVAEISYRLTNTAGVLIAISLFHFSLYFPHKDRIIRPIQYFFIYLAGAFISILPMTKYYISDFTRARSLSDWQIIYSDHSVAIYAACFIFITSWAVTILLRKQSKLDSLYSRKVGYLAASIIIGLIFGLTFDLFFLFDDNVNYIWAGPPFTLIMNIIALWIVFSSRARK